MKSHLSRLDDELKSLPHLHASPEPWNLARSKASINTVDLRKIRQEGAGHGPNKLANMRLIALGGSQPRYLRGTLRMFATLLDEGARRSPELLEHIGELCIAFAWIYELEDHGRGLCAAFEIVLEDSGERWAALG